MIKIQSKKSKTTQYIIGGVVAVIFLGVWISLPLMSGSSLDSSSSAANPFHSKVADISSLDTDIPSEGSAPGTPLNGEMIDNPATSGEDAASSLFGSGADSDSDTDGQPAGAKASADAGAPGIPGPSASGNAPSGSRAGGKLSMVASISGSNGNSMTAGSLHDKFFGTGNQKAAIASAAGPDLKKAPAADNKGMLVAMLSNSADKSEFAAKSGNMDASKGGASSAFTTGAGNGAMSNLDGGMESQALTSGLQLGQTAQDLKKNDPSLSKYKVNLPEPVAKKDDTAEQQMKQMIIQMVVQALLKVALAGFGL
jgi:hypothetical protein